MVLDFTCPEPISGLSAPSQQTVPMFYIDKELKIFIVLNNFYGRGKLLGTGRGAGVCSPQKIRTPPPLRGLQEN